MKTNKRISKVWYYIVMDAFNKRITECTDRKQAEVIAAHNSGYIIVNKQYR